MHFLPELYMHHVPALCLQSSENPEEGMGPPETGVGTVWMLEPLPEHQVLLTANRSLLYF